MARPRTIRVVLFALKGGPLVILGLLVLVLLVSTEDHVFLTFGNVGNVLEQSAGVCVIALGQLLVILTRGIDLSIGSNVSLCCVMCAVVYRDTGSAVLAILATLGAGLAVGVVNGVILVKGRLPHPFIATLATLSIAAGAALYLAGGSTIIGAPDLVNTLGGAPADRHPWRRSGGLGPLRRVRRPGRGAAVLGAAAQAGLGTLDLRGGRQPGGRGPHRRAGQRRADLGLRPERAVRRDRWVPVRGQRQRRLAVHRRRAAS